MLKLHKLLLNEGHPDSFNEAIKPLEDERKALVRAKNDIRDYLRAAIRAASVEILGQDRVVEPRFRTQGSWSYGTCVRPSHQPPQEMDWDFGVYLPVTLWLENGPPPAMARLYFDLVENALLALCKTKGWMLDRTKPTCSRVRIAPWGHIDVPLYAAPEDEFLRVAEKTLSVEQLSARHREFAAVLDEAEELGELKGAKWDFLNGIHMARRDGKWKRTDPEEVANWFEDRVKQHGEQLRRICRYLKAWRDHHWPHGGGPSSIAIMVAVAQSFEPAWHRDDLALEKAATVLARALAGDIREHGIDGRQEDFNRLDADARRAASGKSSELASKLGLARRLSLNLRKDA
ncbi:MAG: CBASS cGAMP synthase, partial [Lentisphaeria bacterium]|nr:CBASS cGAMP synthase [Lentisphaeria bacterium]